MSCSIVNDMTQRAYAAYAASLPAIPALPLPLLQLILLIFGPQRPSWPSTLTSTSVRIHSHPIGTALIALPLPLPRPLLLLPLLLLPLLHLLLLALLLLCRRGHLHFLLLQLPDRVSPRSQLLQHIVLVFGGRGKLVDDVSFRYTLDDVNRLHPKRLFDLDGYLLNAHEEQGR